MKTKVQPWYGGRRPERSQRPLRTVKNIPFQKCFQRGVPVIILNEHLVQLAVPHIHAAKIAVAIVLPIPIHLRAAEAHPRACGQIILHQPFVHLLAPHLHLVAAIDDLKYLRKGGRLPAAVAVAGGMLGIKPLITIKEGKVAMAGKARGLPGAYVALFKKIEELGGVNPRFPSLAGYTISTREVNPIQTYLVDNLGLSEPLVRQIGCVIGTHAGPGAFGLAFFDNGLVID